MSSNTYPTVQTQVSLPPFSTSPRVHHSFVDSIYMNNYTHDSKPKTTKKINIKIEGMMMQQPAMVNPYASAAKTAEIMSRYRPIAPKPMDGGGVAVQDGGGVGGSGGDYVDGMSEKIQQSPYLRNLWPKLQARPTRTRKRGRMIGVSVSPVSFKRTSPPQPSAAAFLGLPPTPPHHYYARWFGRGFISTGAVEKTVSAPVTLPLLPNSPAASPERNVEKDVKIDLKSMAKMTSVEDENDLTLQLRGPESSGSVNVISPRPVRPVGSCITVISFTPIVNEVNAKLKTTEEVEAEIEADEVPSIVTDLRNRVRLINSAYNEMVGQPKCMWLGGRIGGEVLIKFNTKTTTTNVNVMDHGLGFKGWVKIEWGSIKDACNKVAMEASCNVERLPCVSNDYFFAWKFRAV